jgi:signal transduction histidine kinase
VIGRAIRHRRLREEKLEREKAEAEAAIAEERTRIARELHDVVAHAISVIVLQARGGRRLLATDPAEARQALDAIERTASQALAEMRRLLGLLRESDEQLALAPQPTLARLDDLVGQVREAGLPVEVAIEGTPLELPPGIDLSAYRIVQEALTNALKHAGPASARVTVRYGEGELELEVSDDGAGSGNGGGGGQGLAGIRERVAVFGGDVEAGSRPEGGYAVRARLPYASER